MNYKHCITESKKIGEKMDCTVMAIAVALQIPYTLAHKVCTDRGRLPKHRWTYTDFEKVFRDFGCKFIKVDTKKLLSKYSNNKFITTKHMAMFPSIWQELEGIYIAYTRGHVLTIVNGINGDINSNTRSRRITHLYYLDLTNKKISV